MAFIQLPPQGGGGGAVDSVNGMTGIVVITKSSVGLSNVNNTSDANKPVSTATQTALDLKLDDSNIATNNQVIYQNGSGVVEGFPDFFKETTHGGIQFNANRQPDNLTGQNLHYYTLNLDPLQNSPDEKWTLHSNFLNFDVNNSGFNQGTNGNGCTLISNSIANVNTGDNGDMNFVNNYFNLGNGTDAVSARGFSYSYGFGNVNANAIINGAMQGYGYQPNFHASASIDPTAYTNVFYDAANIDCASPNYTTANFSPSIAEIINNNNYNGIGIFPTIDLFTGNAGFFGLNISPNLGDMAPTGSCSMINVNPTVDLVYQQAYGINVTMDNVTLYAGVASSLVFQDLTFTFNQASDYNNSFTMEYTPGATAGSEVVSLVGFTIEVQIESGVSTATQVKAALEANPSFNGSITITISGTGSNAQVTDGPDSFAGGINAGTKKAAYFDGDVEITGSLSFGGALSIGALSAFAQYNVVNGTGNPNSTHTLITQPTLAANESRTLADYLGVNTAMLLNMGDNSSITTGFIGMTALGLPAVLSLGTGATVDLVTGATFALSLDAGAAGGTIDQLSLCRAIAIPNGVTTVTRQYGYEFDNPFGDVGTSTWGFYAKLACPNFLAGSLRIGGTPGSDDTCDSGFTFQNTGASLLEGAVKVTGNLKTAKGIDVAAANDLTLGADGNTFVITGSTQINAITILPFEAGSVINLIFTGSPTVKHNTAGGGGTAAIFLSGSLDFAALNNSVLSLVYDGTQWQEISRKAA